MSTSVLTAGPLELPSCRNHHHHHHQQQQQQQGGASLFPLPQPLADDCDECSTSNIRLPSRLEKSDLTVESVIASGKFSTIYRVQIEKVDDKNGENNDLEGGDDDDSSDASFASDEPYAMKCLSMSTIRTPEAFATAALSLYYEASILSRLYHPNVIKIRGASSECFNQNGFSSRAEGDAGFVVLDLLQGTLRSRLDLWHTQQSRFFKASTTSITGPDGDRRSLSHWSGRLKIASEIANGMKYIHSQGIVFRNLKPENVGFDLKDGSVKLFDFGMARPLEESFADSSVAGSFRYMAPENMLCQPSGCPSDVYSFGVMLWELSTLQLPFEAFFITNKATKQQVFEQTKFTSQVILKSWRPETDGIDCPKTKEVIESCWAAKPETRPSFKDVAETITKAYRSHRMRKNGQAERVANKSPRVGLLRTGSFNGKLQRSNSFNARSMMSTKEGIKRTLSGGKVNRSSNAGRMRSASSDNMSPTRPSRNASMPTIKSSSSDHSSPAFKYSRETEAEATSTPVPTRKRGESLGRRILRRVPSASKVIRGLSSSSHHTASTSMEDSGGLDESDHTWSHTHDERSEASTSHTTRKGHYTVPLMDCRRNEGFKPTLSAASKEVLSSAATATLTPARPSRSVAMPTINSLSSDQSSSSFQLDDLTPAVPTVQPRPSKSKENLGRRLIRTLSQSRTAASTDHSEDLGVEAQESFWNRNDDALVPVEDGGEHTSNEQRKPRRTKSSVQGSSSATGLKLLRNLSGSLMRKKRQSSWSSSSQTSSGGVLNTANAVWDQHPGKSNVDEEILDRRPPRRHPKGARAELSASNHKDT